MMQFRMPRRHTVSLSSMPVPFTRRPAVQSVRLCVQTGLTSGLTGEKEEPSVMVRRSAAVIKGDAVRVTYESKIVRMTKRRGQLMRAIACGDDKSDQCNFLARRNASTDTPSTRMS